MATSSSFPNTVSNLPAHTHTTITALTTQYHLPLATCLPLHRHHLPPHHHPPLIFTTMVVRWIVCLELTPQWTQPSSSPMSKPRP
jgi:hypothetical protein